MQSICLEKLGGEGKVDPRLQETTFIHLTFGGRHMSKVLLLLFFEMSFCFTANMFLSVLCIFISIVLVKDLSCTKITKRSIFCY